MVDEKLPAALLEPVVLLLAREEVVALSLRVVVAERDAERRPELLEDLDDRLHRAGEGVAPVGGGVHVVAREDHEPRPRGGERGAQDVGGALRELPLAAAALADASAAAARKSAAARRMKGAALPRMKGAASPQMKGGGVAAE